MVYQPAKHFELSAELHGHEKPVRTVCALKNGQIVSGAMDCFVLVWGREGTDAEGDSKMEAGEDGVVVEGAGAGPGPLEDGGGAADEHVKRTRDFAYVKKLTHHSDYVYALCDGEAGRNYFFTGGKDKKVFKIEYGTCNTVGVFNGHEGAVNSLAESGGMLYSGRRVCWKLLFAGSGGMLYSGRRVCWKLCSRSREGCCIRVVVPSARRVGRPLQHVATFRVWNSSWGTPARGPPFSVPSFKPFFRQLTYQKTADEVALR